MTTKLPITAVDTPAIEVNPTPEPARYVLGFLFNKPDAQVRQVLLISKRRPDWQAGRYNGIGGRIEPGETIKAAMVREFLEETGVATPMSMWEGFASIGDASSQVSCFSACDDSAFRLARPVTDEPVVRVTCSSVFLGRLPTLPTLKWLVPQALENNRLHRQGGPGLYSITILH